MTRPAPIIAGIVTALLLLFGAHVGTYYALLDANPLGRKDAPVYRYDSLVLHRVFFLAHRLDQIVRPEYWPPKRSDDDGEMYDLPELPEGSPLDSNDPPPRFIEKRDDS